MDHVGCWADKDISVTDPGIWKGLLETGDDAETHRLFAHLSNQAFIGSCTLYSGSNFGRYTGAIYCIMCLNEAKLLNPAHPSTHKWNATLHSLPSTYSSYSYEEKMKGDTPFKSFSNRGTEA